MIKRTALIILFGLGFLLHPLIIHAEEGVAEWSELSEQEQKLLKPFAEKWNTLPGLAALLR